MRNDPLTRWAELFNDADDGLFTLPVEITTMRTVVLALDAERDRVADDRPDPVKARADLTCAYLAAAAGQQDWPDASAVLEVERAAQAHTVRSTTLDAARVTAAGDLMGAVDDLAEQLITEHLRPAFAAALTDLRAASEVLPEDPSGDVLLRAPDKVRKAWLNLDDVTSRLLRARRHAERLGRLRPVRQDEAGEFAAMRNLRQVWPLYQPGRVPPWPSESPRAALLWQVRNGCDLWLPTSAERDAAWLEQHGENVERTRRARQAAGVVSAWGSGYTPSPTAA